MDKLCKKCTATVLVAATLSTQPPPGKGWGWVELEQTLLELFEEG